MARRLRRWIGLYEANDLDAARFALERPPPFVAGVPPTLRFHTRFRRTPAHRFHMRTDYATDDSVRPFVLRTMEADTFGTPVHYDNGCAATICANPTRTENTS